MNSDRRSFFKTLGTAAAAAAVTAPHLTQQAIAGPVPPQDGRAFKVRRSLLTIDETPTGELIAVEGGYLFGVVVEDGVDGSGIMRKHVGGANYQDLELQGGATMGRKFFGLIQDFLAGNSTAFDGSISYSDAKFREGGRLDFSGALVHTVRFPGLNVTSKAAGAIEVICAITESERVKGDGSAKAKEAFINKSKSWLVSNFRLSITGLGEALKTTLQINPLEIKQPILPEVEKVFVEVGPLEVPDLEITVSEQRSEALYEWFENTVVNGNVDERNGTLEILAQDLTTVLFTLRFVNLGIWWLATEDGDESVLRRVTAKMYCEQILFSPGGQTPS